MTQLHAFRAVFRQAALATSLTGLIALMGAAPALAQLTPPTVVFIEATNSLDPIFTPPVNPRQGDWLVDKFVTNLTGLAWTDFHITLQVFNGTSWVDSTDSDGISFGQPTPFQQWLQGVTVDINGVIVPGWHVVRTNIPVDQLDFFFDNFVIQPGDTLSLHFGMTDTIGNNTWRLKQVPTIPEPASAGLWLLGLGGMVLVLRRRLAPQP